MAGREAASDRDLVAECVELYSTHYGKWGPGGPHPGERVRLEPGRFVNLIADDDAWLACAFSSESLIGYCVAVRTQVPGRGPLAWVSQLVVHSSYRQARVATRLLFSVWQFSDCYAWGLVTANPYAIRALETATRRHCRSKIITQRGPEVLEHVASHVPYIPATLVTDGDGRPQPRVDTRFLLDHSDIRSMQRKAARRDRRWALGHLAEGQEWVGCTFSEQSPHAMDRARLADLLTGADEIWIQAYEGMTLDGSHAWHRHEVSEVDFVLAAVDTPPGARVVDVGCGDGRHAKVLADRDYQVVGVDLSERLISRARDRSSSRTAVFEVADARKHLPAGPFDLAVCLYDVIGTSASADDDLLIMRNVAARLTPGGYVVASVMNTSVTSPRLPVAHRLDTTTDFITALEGLSPSATMETTGSVFDPNLLLLYRGVYYRKEQFQKAAWRLPTELVVRDRRFTLDQLTSLVERAGLDVLAARPVQAGAWSREPPLEEYDARAKELLAIGRMPM